MEISEKLRFLRTQEHKTQLEMAEIINKKRTAYQSYESGTILPDIETLIKLADFYNVTLDYLCDRRVRDDLGYLTEEQYAVIKKISDLSEIHLAKVDAYIDGLLN